MPILLINAFSTVRHSSPLVMWSGFMLMSGKLSEKRLPDVAGYHTAMEVGRTSHSLPPFGFPRLRFSQSQRYFCLFSLSDAISLGIQWMSVSTSVGRAYGYRGMCRQTRTPRNGDQPIGDQCEIDERCRPDRTVSIFRYRFLPSTFMIYRIKNIPLNSII